MGVNNVKGGSSSGNLIFSRKYAATAASVIFGEDTQGLDVKMFGDTTGKYAMWDSSADKLIIVGTSDLGTSAEADAFTVGGSAGVDFASGAITNLQIVKGIVTYAA